MSSVDSSDIFWAIACLPFKTNDNKLSDELKEKEFSLAFQNADTVVLCPVYTAGEKINLGFSYLNFAKEIIKNSKVKLFLINDFKQLAIFLKKNMYGKKIVIGMGAGSISNWMRSLQEIILWKSMSLKIY